MSRKIRYVDIIMISTVLFLISYFCYLQLQRIVLVNDLQERRNEVGVELGS
jgi:hypothetical protein